MSPGKFIVFEGLDGAGSTTQCELLAAWLRSRAVPVEVTREPTSGPFGAVIRQAIEGRFLLDESTLALAFAADRSDHVNGPDHGIRALIERGYWVLCDRYILSSLAYQCRNDEDEQWLLELNKRALTPDVTVFVDTSPATCMERITARSSRFELFHKESELTRVLRNYQRFVSRREALGRLVMVDGNRAPDQIALALRTQLTEIIGGVGLDLAMMAGIDSDTQDEARSKPLGLDQ